MRIGEVLIISKEYIEREAAIKAIENDYSELVYYTKEDAIQCVKAIPAADVVEVVRCRECLCYTPVDDNIGKCVFLNGKHQYVVPDGYCYLEELKEGVDDG